MGDNELQQLKDFHFQILQEVRNCGIYDIKMEIEHKIINFENCPICAKSYDELYPKKKIAVVANCICVVCKDCLKTWFNKSAKCTSQTKFCPICFKVVSFVSDKRIQQNVLINKTKTEHYFICDLRVLFG